MSNSPKNLISFLAEGEVKEFPSVKKEMENLENKKKVLGFDLEGVRLSIQKEGQEKFEAKIVLDTLKDFTQKVDRLEFADRPHLFQHLIKSISYGKDEIEVDIFYLPKGYLSNWERGRRALSEATERLRPSSLCLKNRSERPPVK